ncbi:helix-turn-helix domain-containing protein [Poseidonocella sedimentorum]|uniref:histidine kinase n=1 Tax=Poseidonocella sedimentorum TaxID=871652 RepID=A0A1I6CWQ3_9RHOB|nr:helix-turn-helix domain-containing protein [Poseidonocella sedimentorum]SFQ97628.1 hypothetical protein SAMN04515673_101503 [Poseidonocella sedimentorum]
MARSALTGTRIRERRLVLGLKQASLAKAVDISPSYLNLIEHNRRSIGGKLLSAIAQVLEVESAALTEGAEVALMADLREAATVSDIVPEIDRLEEFAGRFPGWARLLADLGTRVTSLEQTVETLTDRLAHDPFLSDALHDILTTVTAIRSTAGILTDTQEIEPDWQRRFLRNIGEDSERLSGTSQSLVAYLDGVEDVHDGKSAPQEELDEFLAAQGFHFPQLEADPDRDLDAVLAEAGFSAHLPAARALALTHLRDYAADARAMPMGAVREAVARAGPSLPALAEALGADLFTLFRRLAALPAEVAGQTYGLATCDASGTLIFRKPLDGFALPRFGSACALWPLFQALSVPHQPLRARLTMPGRGERGFDVYATARAVGPAHFSSPARVEAAMLFTPAGPADSKTGHVGVSCRICPISDCPARREPTILSATF